MPNNNQISAVALREKIERGDSFILMDVREPWEYQMAHIPNSVLMPLGELTHRLPTLNPDAEIITLCHHGIRSMTALAILAGNGFLNVKNMSGGIDAYSQIADPTIPRYR